MPSQLALLGLICSWLLRAWFGGELGKRCSRLKSSETLIGLCKRLSF